MKRAALYVRVSTQEQKMNGLSVFNQIDALKKYCAENGYEIVGIYNDAGISARKSYMKRPALLSMLDDCRAGLIDIILFTKLDRFFRSVSGFYQVQEVLDKTKVPWRAIWEDYTTEDSAGVFKVNIMLAVAQAESDRTSERIKAINAYRRERGDYLGNPPTGYKREGKMIIKDPEKEPGMNAFFNALLKGEGVRNAIRRAHEKGVSLELTHCYKLLRKEAYCNGTIPPYLTKEEFQKIQDTIGNNPRRPKGEGYEFIFSGIVFCGYCGHRLLGHSHKRILKSGKRMLDKTYECHGSSGARRSCPPLYIFEHKIESYLLESLDQLLEDIALKSATLKKEDDAEATRKKLERKLERIKDLYIDGDLTREEYVKRKDSINAELSKLSFSAPSPVKLPSDWRSIYDQLDQKHKQTFWRSILKGIYVKKTDVRGVFDFDVVFK